MRTEEDAPMAKTSMEVVMSEDLKRRLQKCAETAGKTVQEFAQEALYTYVEDIEDGVMSDVALAENGLLHGNGRGEKAIGLDHSVFEAGRKTA
jgi:predicted DNA-binding protein